MNSTRLADLDELALQIRDTNSRFYLQEAISAYRISILTARFRLIKQTQFEASMWSLLVHEVSILRPFEESPKIELQMGRKISIRWLFLS